MKHTILFLAANPLGTDRVALDREARAIQMELDRSGFRDRFELATRWAAEPLDLLRDLRKLKPTVVHFSGHGTAGIAGHAPGSAGRRDVCINPGQSGRESRPQLFFQGPDGGPQLVSTEALEATFGAAGSSVKLIVLSACYSELNAQALLRHVGCVVGMRGAIADDAARSFAIGFYGGLGERESIAAAYAQGCAAISLQGLSDRDRPKLAVRTGVDAGKLILAADPEQTEHPVMNNAPAPLTAAPTSAVSARTTSPAGSAEQPAPGLAPRGDDSFGVHDRLRDAGDVLFEQILWCAQVDRSLFPPPTAELAMRVVMVARQAHVDPVFCARLVTLLDEHAPWTRYAPAAPPGGHRTVARAPGNAASQSAPSAARPSDTGASASSVAPSAEMRERIVRIKREIAAMLTKHPRALAHLAARIGDTLDPRLGGTAELVAGQLVDMRGSEVAEHLLAVFDDIPLTSDGNGDRAALESVLYIVLPYVSDWRDEVAACCARRSGQSGEVELRFRSETIAEAVMAGWSDRPCRFEYRPGAAPYGVGAVQLPATAQTALFTSEQHLLDGVVEQLANQLQVGGLNLNEKRLEVEEELRIRAGRPALRRMRYYFMFRDAALEEASAGDAGALWGLARRTFHSDAGLPSLVLVRLRGQLDQDQAALNRRISAMMQPPTTR